ncbi:MAG: hypothetical protein HY259_02330 [Chloroflexi bacterium]|nr:hypothetical protein [Chloroflexota bacterium]
MKTYKHLYPRICDFENLYAAYRAARKGKRDKAQVYRFEFGAESELVRLQEELAAQTYQPGAYTNFRLNDRKRRLISAAPFRDRVVHHALCNLVEPIFDRTASVGNRRLLVSNRLRRFGEPHPQPLSQVWERGAGSPWRRRFPTDADVSVIL